VIGYKSDLLAITRDDLVRHYRTYYAPNNAVVVAVGDFDSAALLREIREAFEPIPAGTPPPAVRTVEPPQEGERRVTVRRPGGAVPQLQMAFHAPAATDPEFFPALLLDGVLSGFKGPGVFGESMGVRSSRLYRALVEQQLAVDAGSSFRPTVDPTLFEISATLRPGVSPERVEAVALAELKRLCDEPVTAVEVDKLRKQAHAQWVYAGDGVSRQAVLLGSTEIVADGDYLARFTERLNAVTADGMQRTASRLFADRNRTVGWYIPEDRSAEASPEAGPAAEAAAHA
jgi:zinc protease